MGQGNAQHHAGDTGGEREIMTCIGIDPAYAKPVTLAWLESGKRHRDALAKFDRHSRWHRAEANPANGNFTTLLGQILSEAKEYHGATRVCLEDGFIGVNPKVGMRLAEIRGVIKTVATMQGLECRLVAPATWQAACLSLGGVRPQRHREIALAAILRAKHVTGMDLGEDMACAVCLAEWGQAHPEVFGG